MDDERKRETHLWRCHQVHLQQACLQRPLRRPVVFQRVQQERGALLHHVLLHENVYDLVDLGERLVVLGDGIKDMTSNHKLRYSREMGPTCTSICANCAPCSGLTLITLRSRKT